jgi:hypothetical protein
MVVKHLKRNIFLRAALFEGKDERWDFCAAVREIKWTNP